MEKEKIIKTIDQIYQAGSGINSSKGYSFGAKLIFEQIEVFSKKFAIFANEELKKLPTVSYDKLLDVFIEEKKYLE